MTCDHERQESEITVIESVCSTEKFYYYRKKKRFECALTIYPDTNNNQLQIKCIPVYIELKDLQRFLKKYVIEYLPPIRLYLQLPPDYPSQSKPKFQLAITWLPPWEVSLICQRLDDLWQENKGNEIIYIWFEFLKYDILDCLNIHNVLDISFLFALYKQPDNMDLTRLYQLSDSRAINGAVYLHPLQHLLEHQNSRRKEEFVKGFHECGICLEIVYGLDCLEISNCRHVLCKNCIRQFIEMKIKNGCVKDINCPFHGCKSPIDINAVKDVCSSNLFEKYEELLLKVTLNTMKDIIFCPRRICQSPVLQTRDDNLATCSQCEYNFCVNCLKLYHGVTPCNVSSSKSLEIVEQYQKADVRGKKLLEKQYGRRQIQTIVEKHLSSEYLKENTKSCPNCQIATTRIAGCNKMTCSHCQTIFCWLCGEQIYNEDAYDHYKSTKKGACAGRLFENVPEDELNHLDDFDFIDDLQMFT